MTPGQPAITDPRQETCWQIGDGKSDGDLYARFGSGWRAYRRPEEGQ